MNLLATTVALGALAATTGAATPGAEPMGAEPMRAEQAGEAPTGADVNAAIDRGVTFLAGRLAPEEGGRRGKQRAPADAERYGLRALCLYALVKSGVPKDHPAVRHTLLGLALETTDQTYDTSCLILALVAHDPIAHRLWIEDLAADLVAWQEEAGDWSYPGLINDLSNTQYAALGLRAAARAGVSIAPDVWRRLADTIFLYQDETGGYSYTYPGKGATGSMTSAGVGTLAICEGELRIAGALDEELAAQIETSRSAGLAWLADEFSVETNPKSGAWQYYWLYGLERVGALAGTPRIGDHDWYAEGAQWLLAAQDDDGAWAAGADLSETAFALLFLGRATAAEDPPLAPAPLSPRGPAKPAERDAAVVLASEGSGPVRVWIDRFGSAAVRDLEGEGQRGLGPRVVRVEYRSGGELVGVVLGDGHHPAAGRRFAIWLVPASTGPLELTAEVWVVEPEGALRTLASAPHTVDVERALPGWLAQPRPAPRSTRVPDTKARAKGSSEAKPLDGFPPVPLEAELALDGNVETPWLAKPSDKSPSLKLTFQRAPDAGVIAIHPPCVPGWPAGAIARPTEISLKVNGRKTFELELTEPGWPVFVELESPTAIKRLDVEILAVDPPDAELPTGIGEVSLHPAP